MNKSSSDQRRQSENRAKSQAVKQPQREGRYHGTGSSRAQTARLIVQSICGAKRNK